MRPVSRINPLAREISAKIVYYGPGLSGKTTTLQYVHRALKPTRRGELISLATEGDRTIFFDFLPVQVERVGGLDLRLFLYTVPGQVYYAATRRLVLNGADGVVFVGDSQQDARERNVASFDDLRANLADLGIDLAHFPLVIQWNKRDLPGAAPVAELAADLGSPQVPTFETVATRGPGVFDGLKAVVRLVVRDLAARRKAAERPASEPVLALQGVAAAAAEAHAPPAEEVPLSFVPLWGEDGEGALGRVEGRIRRGEHAGAVREAAAALARLLDDLPGATAADGPLARATVIGLDGRHFLRLSRLASAPDETLGLEDALFALHMLVAARLGQGGL